MSIANSREARLFSPCTARFRKISVSNPSPLQHPSRVPAAIVQSKMGGTCGPQAENRPGTLAEDWINIVSSLPLDPKNKAGRQANKLHQT